jgi:hypothetical protein
MLTFVYVETQSERLDDKARHSHTHPIVCKVCIVRLINESRIDECPVCQTPIKPAIEQLRVDRVKQQLVDSGIPEIGTSVGRGRGGNRSD